MSPSKSLIAVTLLLTLCAAHVYAGPGEWAATSMEEVDGDFAWTGEFRSVGSEASKWGLQVYALGEGKFGAALLEGGLPGNGWNQTDRTELNGAIDGDQLVLTTPEGADSQVTANVSATGATIVDAEGNTVATLEKVVRRSVYENAAPPPYAYVLFDGSNTAAFKGASVKDGLLQVGTELIPTFSNYHLHVEFKLPYMPGSRSQSRANSGVYLQSRYEVQVLDSFGLKGVKNECGALYRQKAPDLNMAFPPLQWQTYDIIFRAPGFDAAGQKISNARLTVLHNGVKIHDNVSVQAKTGAGKQEGPIALPTRFQDHSNPVQFRNIWLRAL